MQFFSRIAVLFYVSIILMLGCVLAMLSLNWLNINFVTNFLLAIYSDQTLKIIFGIIGGIILLMNFVFYRLFSVNAQRDKVIAFDNPSGRVSVSLMALEDLVRRSLSKEDDVKESRINIVATRKGLNIKIRLILRREVNIPSFTSKLQGLVTKKIQEIIGVEETINITVYVVKILSEKFFPKTKKDKEERAEPNIPFHGYRA